MILKKAVAFSHCLFYASNNQKFFSSTAWNFYQISIQFDFYKEYLPRDMDAA